jgi:hypothetical protein
VGNPLVLVRLGLEQVGGDPVRVVIRLVALGRRRREHVLLTDRRRLGFILVDVLDAERLIGFRSGRFLRARSRARSGPRRRVLGRLGPVDVLNRREELVQVLEELFALAPLLVLRH